VAELWSYKDYRELYIVGNLKECLQLARDRRGMLATARSDGVRLSLLPRVY
jgi:hypothetical protein